MYIFMPCMSPRPRQPRVEHVSAYSLHFMNSFMLNYTNVTCMVKASRFQCLILHFDVNYESADVH